MPRREMRSATVDLRSIQAGRHGLSIMWRLDARMADCSTEVRKNETSNPPDVDRIGSLPCQDRFHPLCSAGQHCRVCRHLGVYVRPTAWCWTLLKSVFPLFSFSDLRAQLHRVRGARTWSQLRACGVQACTSPAALGVATRRRQVPHACSSQYRPGEPFIDSIELYAARWHTPHWWSSKACPER